MVDFGHQHLQSGRYWWRWCTCALILRPLLLITSSFAYRRRTNVFRRWSLACCHSSCLSFWSLATPSRIECCPNLHRRGRLALQNQGWAQECWHQEPWASLDLSSYSSCPSEESLQPWFSLRLALALCISGKSCHLRETCGNQGSTPTFWAWSQRYLTEGPYLSASLLLLGSSVRFGQNWAYKVQDYSPWLIGSCKHRSAHRQRPSCHHMCFGFQEVDPNSSTFRLKC